jgi:signal transduction histidine kinase
MRSELPPSEETSMLLDMIARNSNRINDLISDLLNSTKATQLNFTRININDLLDQSIAFAQDRIDLKGIKVKKEYGNNLRPVLVDVEKMNIAFLNIIVNAIEATEPKTGEIRISSKDDNNRCVVTISDNGKGMDKESLAKLFEPYFTTKEKGTGLGLTNTQNIILSHQGNIHAESEPGSGSSFIISFNYAEA